MLGYIPSMVKKSKPAASPVRRIQTKPNVLQNSWWLMSFMQMR